MLRKILGDYVSQFAQSIRGVVANKISQINNSEGATRDEEYTACLIKKATVKLLFKCNGVGINLLGLKLLLTYTKTTFNSNLL